MRVQVVTRHCDVPAQVRIRAEERAGRLLRYDARLTAAELIFDEERHVKRVDGILAIEGREPIVAHGEADEFAKALDQAIGRLARILRRGRAQVKDHQAPKLSDLGNAGE
jgi:ribosomal subunit interface protein